MQLGIPYAKVRKIPSHITNDKMSSSVGIVICNSIYLQALGGPRSIESN